MSIDTKTGDAFLSVIMPVLNGASYIRAALSSLRLQRGGQMQCIVVDQGSTDGTLEIIQAYSCDLDLLVLDGSENRSWMENVNIGLKHAGAEFISILHQDDVWKPDRLMRMRDLVIREPGARLYFHPVDYIDASGRVLGTLTAPFWRSRLIPPATLVEHLLVQNFIAIPAPVFRRSDAVAVGGLDTGLWYTADWDFYLKLARIGPAAYLPEVLASFRIHAGSQTVIGSRDAADFARQLEVPLRRHAQALSNRSVRRRAVKVGEFSNALNIYLAQRYHNPSQRGAGRLTRQFLSLGPQGWRKFFLDSRIRQRVGARIRLGWASRRGPRDDAQDHPSALKSP